MQEEGKDKKINSEFKKFQISRIQKKKKKKSDFPIHTLYSILPTFRHNRMRRKRRRERKREKERKGNKRKGTEGKNTHG